MKKIAYFAIIIELVIVFTTVGLIFVKKNAVDVVLTAVLQEKNYSQAEVNSILDSFSKADRDSIEEIFSRNFANKEVLQNVRHYINSNDYMGLEAYVRQTISAEDYNMLMDIYQRYQRQLDSVQLSGEGVEDFLNQYQ